MNVPTATPLSRRMRTFGGNPPYTPGTRIGSSPSARATAHMKVLVCLSRSERPSIWMPSTVMTAKTTMAVPPTTAAGITLIARVTGARNPMTTSTTPAAAVTNRLRTPVTRTMPMFSPLVTMSGRPKNPPKSEVSASPRTVFGTSVRVSISLPTASALMTVWPVASAMEARL